MDDKEIEYLEKRLANAEKTILAVAGILDETLAPNHPAGEYLNKVINIFMEYQESLGADFSNVGMHHGQE